VSNRDGWIGAFRNPTALLIFWALTAVSMAVVVAANLTSGAAVHAALGTAFGGVTGNTIDRLWRGGVVDFVDMQIWPVFNLADAAITAGTLTAILLLI
jgi:signal peptidase II